MIRKLLIPKTDKTVKKPSLLYVLLYGAEFAIFGDLP
jgi:hypothetical protein